MASAQNFVVHASAGPTFADTGYSLAAGFGFTPASRVTLAVNVERTHLASRTTIDGDVISTFRGGTVTLATGELRLAFRRRDRVGPYGVVGFGSGVSRPNVNATFPNPPNPRTTEVGAPFFGGGIQGPIADRVTLFADVRLMLVIGKEADDLFAVMPIRAGLAWHF